MMAVTLTNTRRRKWIGPLLAACLALSSSVVTVEAKSAPVTEFAPAAATVNHKVFLPIVIGGSGSTQQGTQIYWGAMVDGQAPSSGNLQANGVFAQFEATTQKGMSILHWGQPWEMQGAMQPFQTAYFDATRSRGYIPLLDWGSWALGGGASQSGYRLTTITAGNHDAYIRQWAQAAKAWGHPFFLRFDWEMNGTWQFPWAEQINGNQPGDYIRAWRHVHDIFTQVGANNVSWVWCPNISGGTTRAYSALYPGDSYVDWTCMDGYNFYDSWLSSNAVFRGSGINWLYNSYQELLSVAPTKPIMIGETSSLEAGDGGTKKAAWISELLNDTLPNHMPRVKALVWFNWDSNNADHASLPIESSAAAITAFRTGIASDYFTARDFSQLNVSPIPEP